MLILILNTPAADTLPETLWVMVNAILIAPAHPDTDPEITFAAPFIAFKTPARVIDPESDLVTRIARANAPEMADTAPAMLADCPPDFVAVSAPARPVIEPEMERVRERIFARTAAGPRMAPESTCAAEAFAAIRDPDIAETAPDRILVRLTVRVWETVHLDTEPDMALFLFRALVKVPAIRPMLAAARLTVFDLNAARVAARRMPVELSPRMSFRALASNPVLAAKDEFLFCLAEDKSRVPAHASHALCLGTQHLVVHPLLIGEPDPVGSRDVFPVIPMGRVVQRHPGNNDTLIPHLLRY